MPGFWRISRMIVPPQPISMSSACAPRHKTLFTPLRSKLSMRSRLAVPIGPNCPGRLALAENIVQFLLFFKRVHTCPEALVRIGNQFLFLDHAAEWFLDEFLAIMHVVKHLAAEYKESSVQLGPELPNVLDTLHDTAVIRFDKMEGCLWPHAHKASHLLRTQKGLDHRRKRHVGKAVSVICEEDFLVLKVLLNGFQTLPYVGGQPGVNEGDTPDRKSTRLNSSHL